MVGRYPAGAKPQDRDHPMETFKTKAALRSALPALRASGKLALVPTMGYLHDGHLALVRAAKATCNRVVVSIFVNPTQFGDPDDLAKYPQDLERDFALLRAEDVDAVFLPSPNEMYHPQSETIVETTELAQRLMGALRPGHYRGVCTVVTKLLNLVQPDQAFFGEKDYQQLRVIRTMVRDLDIPVEIIGVPTQRESDGLAMSSRNARLTPEDRAAAPVLSAALDAAQEVLCLDPACAVEQLAAQIEAQIAAEPRARVESIDIQDAETLADLSGTASGRGGNPSCRPIWRCLTDRPTGDRSRLT